MLNNIIMHMDEFWHNGLHIEFMWLIVKIEFVCNIRLFACMKHVETWIYLVMLNLVAKCMTLWI